MPVDILSASSSPRAKGCVWTSCRCNKFTMKRFVAGIMLLIASSAMGQEIKLTNLRADARGNDDRRPWLSWELRSSHHDVLQSAYRIMLFDDAGAVWDSHKQESAVSTGVVYDGAALASGHTYYWKAMVWDRGRNDSSKWSTVDTFQTGLFTPADWKGAGWIGYEALPDSALRLPGTEKKKGPYRDTLPLFRKEFRVGRPLHRATAFISGLGQFELRVNGEKTGDHFLDPGWVDYAKKVLYVALDITSRLHQGSNALGVMLGNGFYYIPRERYHKLLTAYGYPKMIARILL